MHIAQPMNSTHARSRARDAMVILTIQGFFEQRRESGTRELKKRRQRRRQQQRHKTMISLVKRSEIIVLHVPHGF